MNINLDELNGWRRTAGLLRVTCRAALKDINAGNINHARQLVETAEDEARRLALRLEKAGADRPDAPPPAFAEGVSLHLLNTPANRRYLSLLRETYEAALAVDRERYGESIGTDGCAQVIEMVLADVEEEVGGAVGLVRE